jgi:D-alanyl-D-alanine carboxypeptidase
MSKAIYSPVLFIVMISCGSVQKPRIDQVLLQQTLDALVSEVKVPGASLAIILPNGDSISLVSGLSDVEKNLPMRTSHRMLSGSVGKTYVAAIVFRLIEDNRLKLTDRVVDILTDDWVRQIPNAEIITIDMLLGHTSGLPRYEYFDEVWGEVKENPDRVWSVYDRLKLVFGAETLHPAGEGWGYSDTNYIILGAIIEKVTGKEYYANFREMIAGLPNLNSTSPSDTRRIHNLAGGYSGFLARYGFTEKVCEAGTLVFNPQMEWCGGGVVSTTTDLARWVWLLYQGRVVSSESIYSMVTPSNYRTDLADNACYGYGTIIWENDSLTLFGHTGFFPGYRTIVQYSPKYRFAIALQVNRDNPQTDKTLNQLLEPFREVVTECLK